MCLVNAHFNLLDQRRFAVTPLFVIYVARPCQVVKMHEKNIENPQNIKLNFAVGR